MLCEASHNLSLSCAEFHGPDCATNVYCHISPNGVDCPQMGTSLVREQTAERRPHGAAIASWTGESGAHSPIPPSARPGTCWHVVRYWTTRSAAPPSEGATILLRSPPIPAALLTLTVKRTRDRFRNLLHMANLEVDVCNAAATRSSDWRRVHALMFTDDLELIRSARQLPSGVATHIVFVGESDELQESDALRAGANDCMPSDARGEHFWAHLTMRDGLRTSRRRYKWRCETTACCRRSMS